MLLWNQHNTYCKSPIVMLPSKFWKGRAGNGYVAGGQIGDRLGEQKFISLEMRSGRARVAWPGQLGTTLLLTTIFPWNVEKLAADGQNRMGRDLWRQIPIPFETKPGWAKVSGSSQTGWANTSLIGVVWIFGNSSACQVKMNKKFWKKVNDNIHHIKVHMKQKHTCDRSIHETEACIGQNDSSNRSIHQYKIYIIQNHTSEKNIHEMKAFTRQEHTSNKQTYQAQLCRAIYLASYNQENIKATISQVKGILTLPVKELVIEVKGGKHNSLLTKYTPSTWFIVNTRKKEAAFEVQNTVFRNTFCTK